MLNRIYKSSPRLRKRAHQAKDAATYRLVQTALALARSKPLDEALLAADRLADFLYPILRKNRRLSLEHLEIVFGDEMSLERREEVARQSVRGFARSFVEAANIEEIRPQLDRYVTLHGWEAVEPHLSQGGVVCSAHLGNWEILAAYMVQVKGLTIAAVARRLDDDGLNRLLNDFRLGNGMETILRESEGASRQILRVLKKRGFLAMLVDQDTKVPSITVPFLGRPARTPVAPALLAVRRNLPIIVAYALRRPEGGHDLIVCEPLFPDPEADRDREIQRLTIGINEILGNAIRERPEQWAWWHRRWRRPPVERLDPDAAI